jgi:hypothetical protein
MNTTSLLANAANQAVIQQQAILKLAEAQFHMEAMQKEQEELEELIRRREELKKAKQFNQQQEQHGGHGVAAQDSNNDDTDMASVAPSVMDDTSSVADMDMRSTPVPSTTGAAGTTKLPKQFVCPHPTCKKVYKNSNGLKYHLTHGHAGDPYFAPNNNSSQTQSQQQPPPSIHKASSNSKLSVNMNPNATLLTSPHVGLNSAQGNQQQQQQQHHNFLFNLSPAVSHPGSTATTAATATSTNINNSMLLMPSPNLGDNSAPSPSMSVHSLNSNAGGDAGMGGGFKPFACFVPGCVRAYKNAGGLRFHLQQVHPDVISNGVGLMPGPHGTNLAAAAAKTTTTTTTTPSVSAGGVASSSTHAATPNAGAIGNIGLGIGLENFDFLSNMDMSSFHGMDMNSISGFDANMALLGGTGVDMNGGTGVGTGATAGMMGGMDLSALSGMTNFGGMGNLGAVGMNMNQGMFNAMLHGGNSNLNVQANGGGNLSRDGYERTDQ